VAWLAAVIVTIPISFGLSLRLPPSAVGIVEAAVLGLVLVAVLYRFGLLALTIANGVGWVLFGAPLTLDASRWYFWQGAFVVVLVLGLAIWGFKNVLGKQTLLPAGALEE
jgi:hypothetical protein